MAIHADDSGAPAGLSMTAGTESRTQDRRRAQMLDRCAGDAYRAGNHSQALCLLALARAADPSMAAQRDEHRARVSAARRAAEPSGQPLAEVVASRLAEAGVTPDDPALRRIAEHNVQAQARAGMGPTAAAPACEKDATAAAPAVSVSGARLRLRAMVAIGHSPARIARALGEDLSTRTVQRMLRGAATAMPQHQLDRIRDLYEQWWDLCPPARTRGERAAATLARRQAREAAWCTGMGLDDDQLDTPGYEPHCAWRPATGTGTAADDPLGGPP